MPTARHLFAGTASRGPAAFRLAGIVLLVGLAACSAPEPVPQDHYYRLDIPAPRSFETPTLDGVVEVNRLSADGVTAGRPIVHSDSTDALELKAYHYHFWSEPPGVMLRDALVKALRAAGAARQVVTPDTRVRPDYAITGELKRFERVVGAQPDKAVLELELVLRQARSDELLLLRSYRVERDVPGDGMNRFVAAMNDAVAEAYQRFLADLAKL